MESFVRVAEEFQVPASGISQSIRRLESELNAKLFIRKANKISLTEEGKIFYDGAKRALDILEVTALQMGDNSDAVKGKISVAVLVNTDIMSEIIEEFKRDYPEVKLEVTHNQNIKSGDADIIISDELIYFKKYEKIKLFSEDIVLAARKDNPIVKGGITSERLKIQKYGTMPDKHSLYHYTFRICYENGFVPNITMSDDNPESLIKCVENGGGVLFVPKESWGKRFSDNVALLRVGNYKRSTCLFLDREKCETKAAKLFIERIVNYKF